MTSFLGLRPWALALSFCALGACGHGHGAGDGEDHSHDFVTKFGGVLVGLGDHVAQLEVVHDGDAGTLEAYVYDAHADGSLRLTQPAMGIEVQAQGKTFMVSLDAQASTLTGETVGDSSEFRATDQRLKGLVRFTGRVRAVNIKGSTMGDVSFHYPGE